MTNERLPLMLLNCKKNNRKFTKLNIFLAQVCLDNPLQWTMKYVLWSLFNCKKYNGVDALRYSLMEDSPSLIFSVTQLYLDAPPQWQLKYFLWCSSIARKTMVEMLYGAPQWEIHQVWYFSCSIVSRYSPQLSTKYFLWCSSIVRKLLVHN